MDILEDRDEWLATYRSVWLAHFEETGETNWKIYNRPNHQQQVGGPGIDLASSRLALVTSSGAHLRDEQEPYDAPNPLGDYTIRTFPVATPLGAVAFAHTHYDHTAVNDDPQVLIPLRHLEALESEGVVGSLAPSVISFMGYQPDATRIVDETIPGIVQAAQEQEVQAALLVPA